MGEPVVQEALRRRIAQACCKGLCMAWIGRASSLGARRVMLACIRMFAVVGWRQSIVYALPRHDSEKALCQEAPP
jgi:hypothetical protein